MSCSELTFAAAVDRLVSEATEGSLALLIHAHPDGDCVGSAYALAALLGCLGCETRVICADKLPERLKFIAGDRQTDILEPAEGRFAPGCRAVALDVASPSQLGTLEGKYDVVLTLDHHASSTAFSDRYLDPAAAATGEIVWRVARELKRRGAIDRIPHETAAASYAAISSDTGCFKYSNVTAQTHRAAAQLVSEVPERSDIDRLLFDTKTPARLEAERAALEVLKISENGKIAICAMTESEIALRGLLREELDALIDVARSVAGVEVAFSVREETPGRYRVSARSNGRGDVAALCAAFGGGGHVRAAGCTIVAPDISTAVSLLVDAAAKLV